MEFADRPLRYPKMGWRGRIRRDYTERLGYPYLIGCAGCVMMIVSTVLCFFADRVDREFTKECRILCSGMHE